MMDDQPITREMFDAMLARADLNDDRPEMVEVVARSARRLIHAAEPAVPVELTEPFDLQAEVAMLRAHLIPLITEDATGERSVFAFLHAEAASDGPFDRAIWRETMALGRSEPQPVLDDPAAQAYALSTVALHILNGDQLREAATTADDDLRKAGVRSEDIDLDFPTTDDRRHQAMVNVITRASFIYEEYFRP